MIIKRTKSYSDDPRKKIDDGIYRVADRLDYYVDYADKSNPVVSKASKRWRDRISGYTKPIKKLISGKKEKSYSSLKLKQFSENLSREDKIRIGKLRIEIAKKFADNANLMNAIIRDTKKKVHSIKIIDNNIDARIKDYLERLKIEVIKDNNRKDSCFNFDKNLVILGSLSDTVILAHEAGHAINKVKPKSETDRKITELNNKLRKTYKLISDILPNINRLVNDNSIFIRRSEIKAGRLGNFPDVKCIDDIKKVAKIGSIIILEELNASKNAIDLLKANKISDKDLEKAIEKLDLMVYSYLSGFVRNLKYLLANFINIPSRRKDFKI